MEKEFWLFTLLTKRVGYINCWFNHFPTKSDLLKRCSDCGDKDGAFAIINVTKFTELQYRILTEQLTEQKDENK